MSEHRLRKCAPEFDERQPYTSMPKTLRIVRETKGMWLLDGVELGPNGGVVKFTETCETYRSHKAALAGVPAFLDRLIHNGTDVGALVTPDQHERWCAAVEAGVKISSDWCRAEDKVTLWAAEECISCGRLWGEPLLMRDTLAGSFCHEH